MTWEWSAGDAVIDLGNGLWQLDLGFQGRRGIISAWLLAGERGHILIETGPSSTLEQLSSALATIGLETTSISTILLTHIHLDHAGAAGLLAQANPDANVYVHPFGAPHLVDPTKLISSATRIYGDQMDTLWGTILPIPEAQVVEYEDGSVLELDGRRLQVIFTPGHAWHHVAIFEADSGDLFTGDVAGIRMPGFGYVCPPTPPPDFDPDSWSESIDRLQRLGASRLCLAHFGHHSEVEYQLAQIEPNISTFIEIGERHMEDGDQQALIDQLHAQMASDLDSADPEVLLNYEMATPSYMAAMGLTRYLKKRAERAQNAG